MLWKLLKYDFRAMGKSFAILWPASLLVALVNRFVLPFDRPVSNELLALITMIAFFSVLFAMGVAVMIFIVQRFYKGLLGDEGYLMHTLPVPTWQLAASKLICALVTALASVVVTVLAILILLPIRWGAVFRLETLQGMLQALRRQPDFPLYLLEFFISLLCCFLIWITLIYLAIAVGHLFQRRRVIISVAAFIGLDILMSVYIDLLDALNLFQALMAVNNHLVIWAIDLALLIPSMVFFVGTCAILHNRLNLE